MTSSIDHRIGLLEDLADTEYASEYLLAALDDGHPEVFLLALKDVVDARGLASVARTADLNREHLYRLLSGKGNPRLSSLRAILDACGLQLAVVPRACVEAELDAAAADEAADAAADEAAVAAADEAADAAAAADLTIETAPAVPTGYPDRESTRAAPAPPESPARRPRKSSSSKSED